ncbi:hypothetical protein ACFPK9_13540 [Rubritalea spongiae]|uniref:SecDF P1 head subdomain domain-containing protein n=1 Tax=Rubritalea spongiae TaxID=430797 RepID=A0ABW5E041_9BACT
MKFIPFLFSLFLFTNLYSSEVTLFLRSDLSDKSEASMKQYVSIVNELLEENNIKANPITYSKDSLKFQSSSLRANLKQLERIFTPNSSGSPIQLGIHARHPECDSLTQAILAGTQDAPTGYKLVQMQNKSSSTKYLLISEPHLTEKDIINAFPDRSTNAQVYITLTNDGAEKMKKFTRSLTSGSSFIVTTFNGKAVNNAILNAEVLSKNFVISGLDDRTECEQLASKLLSASAPTHFISKVTVSSQ